MSEQLDLDDVAATSELAKQELAALRAENQRMREALERLAECHWTTTLYEAHNIARAALGKE